VCQSADAHLMTNDMAASRPSISIVLPTYNRQTVLPRAITSVLAQNEPDWELIIVDDGSTDQTRVYLASLDDPRIRVITLANNRGVSAARNVGLEATRADIVAFLDSDDAYLQQRLSAPLAIFASEPDVVCVLSSGLKHDRHGCKHVSRMPDAIFDSSAFEWGLFCGFFEAGATSITVRRSAAIAVGGFRTDLRWAEDQEFLVRVALQGRGRMLSATLWDKYQSDDALSHQWAEAGVGLLSYARAHPDLFRRYRKVASYLATKYLIYELRGGLFMTALQHLKDFRRAGLIDGTIWQVLRDHRDVKRYRRSLSSPDCLSRMTGPPTAWA
jgi:glycosyltransferase involved in cell wall biosynthesis